MGLLNKFFNDGNITDRYGTKVGHISHLDDHAALVYDEDCKIVGRIYEYGDTLEFLNEKNMLTARGKSYGRDEILEVIGLDGNRISKVEKHNGSSYQTNRYDCMATRIYNSDTNEEDSDGLGPEYWDNCFDDDDDDY